MPMCSSASGFASASARDVESAASTGPIPHSSVPAPSTNASSRAVAAKTRITRLRGAAEREESAEQAPTAFDPLALDALARFYACRDVEKDLPRRSLQRLPRRLVVLGRRYDVIHRQPPHEADPRSLRV